MKLTHMEIPVRSFGFSEIDIDSEWSDCFPADAKHRTV